MIAVLPPAPHFAVFLPTRRRASSCGHRSVCQSRRPHRPHRGHRATAACGHDVEGRHRRPALVPSVRKGV